MRSPGFFSALGYQATRSTRHWIVLFFQHGGSGMAWVAVKGDEAVTWDGWYSRAFMGVPESLEPLNFCESEDEKVGLNLRQLGVAMQGANFIPDFDESVTEYLKARVDWRHWRPSAAELSRFDSNDIVAFLNLGDLNLHSSASSDE